MSVNEEIIGTYAYRGKHKLIIYPYKVILLPT